MKIEFLHIGLHKTASTWLQNVVFDQHPDLHVFHPATRIKNSHTVIEQIYRTPEGSFDPNRWWTEFNHEIEHLDISGKTAGISYEILAGDMIHGRDAAAHAKRCHDLFGPVKVILELRHPVDYINSMYQQYVVQGGAFTLQMLLQDKTIPGADIAHKIDYMALINTLHQIWSPENVLVLPFELMRADQQDFLKCIWDFLDVDSPAELDANVHVRESVSGVAQQTQRLLNALGIPMQQTRGRIRRLDERLIRRMFPWKYKVGLEKMLRWQPLLKDVLVDERYHLWDGELARYNYRFQSDQK
jgi:hypothetical protein